MFNKSIKCINICDIYERILDTFKIPIFHIYTFLIFFTLWIPNLLVGFDHIFDGSFLPKN